MYNITDAFIDALLESENKKQKIDYISKKDLDKIPNDYKCKIKDIVKTSEYRGEKPDEVLNKYKELGYDENDPAIMELDKNNGTVLTPKKVKDESTKIDTKTKGANIIATKLQERKTYSEPVWHTYTIGDNTYDFRCQYYEVSGSNQASLWGHEADFKVNGLTVSHAKISYYNRTWESFQYQSCMLNALDNYIDNVKKSLFNKARDNQNINRLNKQYKEQILTNNYTYQELLKLREMISNGDKGVVEENKKINVNKSQILKEDDEDEVNEETVSLLNKAYREIPKIGVEDWGKDNELNFLIDTRELLTYLDYMEVEIPESVYENAAYDDWSNGVDTYLEDYKGIDPDSGESNNTYNWCAPVIHDIEYTTYDTEDSYLIKASVHKDGDVRGNYTTEFLLEFDSKEDFYEEIYEICSQELNHIVELGNKSYNIQPNIFSEYVNIYDMDDVDNSWDDVYCEDMDQLKEIVGYTDNGEDSDEDNKQEEEVKESKQLNKKIEKTEHPTGISISSIIKMFDNQGLDTEYNETLIKCLIELGYINKAPTKLRTIKEKQEYRKASIKSLNQEDVNKIMTAMKDKMQNDYQFAKFMEVYTYLTKYIVD